MGFTAGVVLFEGTCVHETIVGDLTLRKSVSFPSIYFLAGIHFYDASLLNDTDDSAGSGAADRSLKSSTAGLVYLYRTSIDEFT